jgi:hypothetical protein
MTIRHAGGGNTQRPSTTPAIRTTQPGPRVVTREVVSNLKDAGAGWGLVRQAESLANKPASEQAGHEPESTNG